MSSGKHKKSSCRHDLVLLIGFYLVHLSCSLTSTDKTYTTKLVLHERIYDETYAKTGLKFGPPLIWLWLLEVHVC